MSEFENLKGKFTDSKIILLAALKVEDEIFNLNKRLDSQKNIKLSLIDQKEKIDNKIKEAVILEDQIFSLKEKNLALKEKDRLILNEVNSINKKLVLLINKILSRNEDDN